MSSKIDKLHFILVGMSGAVMGLKAALLHGGEVKAEVLNMLQRDIDEAQQVLAQLDVEPTEFTKNFRKLIKLSEEHLSNSKIGRLRTKGKMACDIIDQQQADKNKQAIKLLEEWFAELDDMGEEFWREFDDIVKNRFTIGE